MGTTTFVVFSDTPALPWTIAAENNPENRRLILDGALYLIDIVVCFSISGDTPMPINISATFWI